VLNLISHLLDGLDELQAKVVTPRAPERRGALICVKSTDATALVARLGEEGIVTSDRDNNLRISAHCYNTVEDIDTVLGALQRHRTLLA
jgi:kynureninase